METDPSHAIDNLVREMSDDESASIRKIREMLHRCVDESCDQLEMTTGGDGVL